MQFHYYISIFVFNLEFKCLRQDSNKLKWERALSSHISKTVIGTLYNLCANNTIVKLQILSMYSGKLMGNIKTETSLQQLMTCYPFSRKSRYPMLAMWR